MSSMASMILQTIQILITLTTNLTPIWLILFHSSAIQIWCIRLRIDDRNGSVRILLKGLVLVAMQTMIFQTVLVFVSLLTSYNRTFVRFVFIVFHYVQMTSRIVDIHCVVFISARSRRFRLGHVLEQMR